jgi:hypothetical protein
MGWPLSPACIVPIEGHPDKAFSRCYRVKRERDSQETEKGGGDMLISKQSL